MGLGIGPCGGDGRLSDFLKSKKRRERRFLRETPVEKLMVETVDERVRPWTRCVLKVLQCYRVASSSKVPDAIQAPSNPVKNCESPAARFFIVNVIGALVEKTSCAMTLY